MKKNPCPNPHIFIGKYIKQWNNKEIIANLNWQCFPTRQNEVNFLDKLLGYIIRGCK